MINETSILMTSVDVDDVAPEAVTPLGDIWHELVGGRAFIVSAGLESTHYFLRLAPTHLQLTAHDARNIQLLQRLMFGESQKELAYGTGYSASTIATAIGAALSTLGFSGSAGRLPVVLPILYYASLGLQPPLATRVIRAGEHANDLLVVTRRLEPLLQLQLTSSELSVVALLLDGHSHQAIASHRATSVRTVANQLASAYKKLRLTGRLELLRHLVKTTPLPAASMAPAAA